MEPPLNLLTSLKAKVAAALVVVAIATAAGGWLYVTGLQATNARLQTQVSQLTADKQRAERNADALSIQLVAVETRARQTTQIKEAIREAPTGTVPADIRTALERLRDR